jgi:hypothetical protein
MAQLDSKASVVASQAGSRRLKPFSSFVSLATNYVLGQENNRQILAQVTAVDYRGQIRKIVSPPLVTLQVVDSY